MLAIYHMETQGSVAMTEIIFSLYFIQIGAHADKLIDLIV